jgi:RNA polymerase primary sigma factor
MNSKNRYLSELKGTIKLSQEEELTLIKLSKQGNKQAQDRLVKANLKFVISIANQYPNKFLTPSDLVNEGNMGMIEAIRMYDESRGMKFITYAVYWIRKYIFDAIQEYTTTVRYPVQIRHALRKHDRLVSKQENLGLNPLSEEEIKKQLDVTDESYSVISTMSNQEDSLDFKVEGGEDGYSRLTTTIFPSPDYGLYLESIKTDIQRIFTRLNDSEKQVLTLTYGLDGNEPYFPDDIGRALGISSERARQIRENGLKKLRRYKILQKYNY